MSRGSSFQHQAKNKLLVRHILVSSSNVGKHSVNKADEEFGGHAPRVVKRKL